MPANFNKTLLCGTVTRDPELRFVGQNKSAVTDLSLAINDRRKGANGEWVEETTYCDVTLWGRQAEVAAEHARKGANVLVEGRLKTESWNDKTSGEKRSKLKVVCERMQLLGSKGAQERPAAPPPQASAFGAEVPDEEIPF